jgi:hypothetical protein
MVVVGGAVRTRRAVAISGDTIARMNPRPLVAGIALGRVAIGAALTLAPRKPFGAGWIGKDAERTTSQLLFRSVGARDAGIGLGTLAALKRGDALLPWVLGAALADGVDLVGTLLARKAIPRNALLGVGALAGGTAIAELALARELR